MKITDKNRTFLFIFALIAVVAFLIVRPLLNDILMAGVLAYLFHPLYKLIRRVVKFEALAAFVVSFLVVISVFALTALIITNLIQTAAGVVPLTGALQKQNCTEESVTLHCQAWNFLESFDISPVFANQLETGIRQAGIAAAQLMTRVFLSLPNTLFDFFIVIFLMYYVLKAGPRIARTVEDAADISRARKSQLIKRARETVYGVIFGTIIVAIVQGVLTGLGLWLFGVTGPLYALFWGIIAAVLSILPYVGASVVWGPAAVIMAVTGFVNQEIALVWKAIGLVVYGVVLVSMSDNFIRSKVIGGTAKINPAVVLVGVIGGLGMFGFVGLFLGPVILALFITFLEMHRGE